MSELAACGGLVARTHARQLVRPLRLEAEFAKDAGAELAARILAALRTTALAWPSQLPTHGSCQARDTKSEASQVVAS